MFDFKKLKKYRGRDAVSPVVATLILIIVAIVGAVAVGLIVSGIGTSTGKQANANGAGSNTQSIIYVGGSTTVYPVTDAAIPAFEAANPGITISIAQGGSDAGMQGLLTGAYDVGEASSVNAVNNLYTAIANNGIIGVTPDPVLIGGSGVVFATTSNCGPITVVTGTVTCATPTAVGTVGATPFYDGAAACLEVTRDALAKMYDLGSFYIETGACGGAAAVSLGLNLLDAACIASVATGPYTGCGTAPVATGVGPYVSVSRSDEGGTEDTACGYLTGDQNLLYVGGSGSCGGSKAIGSGNLGVLQQTQACTATATGVANVIGCVGFFDIGFAEGASSQAQATCPGVSHQPCKVFIDEVTSSGPTDKIVGAYDALVQATSTGSGFAYTNDSTAGIDSLIKGALKTEATVNPQTLQIQQASNLNKFFPDALASGASNPLDRTFYLVTNGAPTATVQKFLLFMTSYNADPYFQNAGYYSQYEISSA